jgi:hypothetical protein
LTLVCQLVYEEAFETIAAEMISVTWVSYLTSDCPLWKGILRMYLAIGPCLLHRRCEETPPQILFSRYLKLSSSYYRSEG